MQSKTFDPVLGSLKLPKSYLTRLIRDNLGGKNPYILVADKSNQLRIISSFDSANLEIQVFRIPALHYFVLSKYGSNV